MKQSAQLQANPFALAEGDISIAYKLNISVRLANGLFCQAQNLSRVSFDFFIHGAINGCLNFLYEIGKLDLIERSIPVGSTKRRHMPSPCSEVSNGASRERGSSIASRTSSSSVTRYTLIPIFPFPWEDALVASPWFSPGRRKG